jgi:hypothetical protein
VDLDGPHGHEQRLRDLPVAAAGRRQLRDPALAAGQGVDAGQGGAARPQAEPAQLVPRSGGDRQAAAAGGEVQRATQGRGRGAAPAGPAQRGAEVDQHAGLVQPCG